MELQKIQSEVKRMTVKRMTTVKDVTPWEPLVPFTRYDVPSFPVDAFPGWLRNYVLELAESTQTPVDLASMLAMAVCATATAKKAVVTLNSDWSEPLNIYVVVALPPASRKSAVFQELLSPIITYEKKLVKDTADVRAFARNEEKVLEQTVKSEQGKAAKGVPGAKEKAYTASLELEKLDVPTVPRLVADDITAEKLVGLLVDQSEKIGIFSAEGGLFDILAGRYTENKINLDIFLKGHAGDLMVVDRVSRKTESIENPTITIGLTVQPAIIRQLADVGIFRGRGLLARFLYALPVPNIGRRKINAKPVAEELRQAYQLNIKTMLGLADNDGEPHKLALDNDAKDIFDAFQEWLEPLLAEEGELGTMQDWSGKLAGVVARIAGILHMVEHKVCLSKIKSSTMRHAIMIGREYLIPHALAAFAEMGANPGVESAKHILKLVKKLDVGKISKRDLQNKLQSRFKKVSELDAPLALLFERNYIRREKQSAVSKTGRSPSPVFEINPQFFRLGKEGTSVPSVPFVCSDENEKNNYAAGEI